MEPKYISKPLKIGRKISPNRLVYQPTEGNNADRNGNVTSVTIKKYVNLAKGGPGMLFVESLDINREAQARSNRMLGLEENLPGLKTLVSEIKAANDQTLVVFQLSHAGALSDPSLGRPMYVYARDGDARKPMTTAEIEAARDEFVTAAEVSAAAGADGVDVKQAHGFLAGDFLHPANTRNDRYGGSFENRIRFFTEVATGIRRRITDPGFILGSRISPYEGVPGGCGTSEPEGMIEDLSEMLAFAEYLEKMKIDFINVSAGYASANLEILMPTKTYPEGVFRHFYWTRAIKSRVSIPVIGSAYSYLRDGNNGIHEPDKEKMSLLYWAEKNIREGCADLAGLGRQSIADPFTAGKLLSGKGTVDWCTACGGCGTLLGNQKAVGCTVYDPDYKG